jgi:predicted SprT family Zn-dependent metalloprotease
MRNLKEFDELYQETVAEVSKIVDFPENWNEWHYEVSGRTTRIAGWVNFATKEIGFSKQFIKFHSEDIVKRDIILHELAHVMTEGHEHDEIWAEKCRIIGGTGEEMFKSSADYQRLIKKYELYCPNCGEVISYHRKKAKKALDKACGKCCQEFNQGKFTEKYLLKYREVQKTEI